MPNCRILVHAGLVFLLATTVIHAAEPATPPPPTHWEAAQQAISTGDEALRVSTSPDKSFSAEKVRADLARALADMKACVAYDQAQSNPGPWWGKAMVSELSDLIKDYRDQQEVYLTKEPKAGVAFKYLLAALNELQQLPGGDEGGARYRVVDDFRQAFADTVAAIYHAQLPPARQTALSAPVGAAPSPLATMNREGYTWVEKCLTDFETIKVGMPRSQIESRFPKDGGLQTDSPVRFLHPTCPDFKIDVEFNLQHNYADQGRTIEGKDDIVIRVSKPYIERVDND